MNGGYILHFRHAERDKWTDVEMYDALETELQNGNSNSFRFAENEYFESAVCLNKRGKIQAEAMGEVIKYSKLPVSYVISSPSCRARQTADLVFGGYDFLEKKFAIEFSYFFVVNPFLYFWSVVYGKIVPSFPISRESQGPHRAQK